MSFNKSGDGISEHGTNVILRQWHRTSFDLDRIFILSVW